MPTNILLLSIRPEYANKIFFDKTKEVELRRVRPRLVSGDLVLVYVSSPRKAVIGSFTVKEIIEKAPEYLWEEVENKAGISQNDFWDYYGDAELAVGIFLKDIQIFMQEVSLKALRHKWPGFRPPQSYRYLKKNEFELVNSLGQGQKSIGDTPVIYSIS